MKTPGAILSLGLITCTLLCRPLQAVPLSGNIIFAGTVSLDSASADTATMVTAWHGLGAGGNPQVQGHDGGFNGFVTNGDATIFQSPWSFNSGPVSSFWSVDGFLFDLIASAVTHHGSGAVDVSGTGTISGHGFDPSPGSWQFSTQNPSANSEFSFSAATGVPDGGSALCLLGLALAGIEGLRRRFRVG
jgi:VPDSG-CTERM motif